MREALFLLLLKPPPGPRRVTELPVGSVQLNTGRPPGPGAGQVLHVAAAVSSLDTAPALGHGQQVLRVSGGRAWCCFLVLIPHPMAKPQGQGDVPSVFGAAGCQPGLQRRLWVLPEVPRCAHSAQPGSGSGKGRSWPGGCHVWCAGCPCGGAGEQLISNVSTPGLPVFAGSSGEVSCG